VDKNEKPLESSLENWRRGAASVEDVRSLAQDLGARLYKPGIPVLIELLDNQDDMVRYNAAASLAMNFVYIPATGRLLTMLASDRDEDCRSMAASCLASLRHDTKDHVALAALAKASLQDPDEYVRDSAYHALLFVNGLPKEQRQDVFQNHPHVDPGRVRSILGEISETRAGSIKGDVT
jgi:HEAT repeat protein